MKTPRQYSLVKFNWEDLPVEYHKQYPFSEKPVIFMGEIPNMPGHCVVADGNRGQIYSGYHTENFIELDEDEV